MIHLLRKLSLQTRLMALFVIPGSLIIFTIPLIVSLYQSLSLSVDQGGVRDLTFLVAARYQFAAVLMLIVSILFILFVMTLILGRSILNPLDDLRSSLTAFQIGRHTILIRDESNDELGELVRSLNYLAKQLSNSYISLEDRIDQRTEALAQRASYLHAAAELARDTTSLVDIDELLDRSVSLIRDRFSLFFVGVYLLDPMSDQAILRSGTGDIGAELLKRGHRYQVGQIGLVGQVVANGESRVVNDVNADYVYQRHQLLDKTTSQAVLPLKIGSHIIGALDVHGSSPGGFDPSVVSVLQIMADQLSVALQNASLVEDLKVRIQETNMLYQRYAQENWSLAKLRASEIVYEFDRIRTMQYWQQFPPELVDRLRNGQPIVIGNDGFEKNNNQLLYIPLLIYNQLVGVIGLEKSDADRNWTSEEISTLEALSHQISMALDNSRLLEETQRRSDQIRLLHGVTSIAASHVFINDLMSSVAEKLRQEFFVDYCDVLWFESDNISATYIASSVDEANKDNSAVHKFVPVAENPLFQHLFDANKSVELYDLDRNPLAIELRDLAIQRGVKSAIITPLNLRSELFGAIIISTCEMSRRFNNEEIALMDQISLQLSSALEVARTFEQTSKRAEREREIREATQKIRETLDLPSILSSAASELREVLDVPEVTIRITNLFDKSSIEKLDE